MLLQEADYCRYCGDNAGLCNSHIIPKFVFEYVKENSLGTIRFNKHINRTQQDGYKLYWLCKKCEGKFGRFEEYFSEEIFIPFVNGHANGKEYDNRLSKFLASIVWRVLKHALEKDELSKLSEKNIGFCINALNVWHDFLEEKIKNMGAFELHLHNYTHEMPSHFGVALSPTIHQYLCGAYVEWNIEKNNSGDLYVYVKIPGFVIIGCVQTSKSKKWRVTRISPRRGFLRQKSHTNDIVLWKRIQQKANEATAEYCRSLSLQQQKKIKEQIMKNLGKYFKTKDSEMFVKDIKTIFPDLSQDFEPKLIEG